jgi:hypothetical protein
MKETFAVLNQMVADGAIDNYALAGAVGAMFYVEPFSTHDIDVLIVIPETEGKLIAELPGWKYLSSRGYSEIRGEGIVVEGWPVQFLPVSNALEHEAYLNATNQTLDNVTVRVVQPEHLVAMMLKVGRLKDFARIQMFLSQDAINSEVLEDILQRYDLNNKWDEFRGRFLS